MSRIKECLMRLPDYSVSQTGYTVKLNQNENPVDWPESLKRRVLEELGRSSWNRYPDGSEAGLLSALSDYTGLPESWILSGNGSNEMIQVLVQAVCRPEDRMVTVSPGFSVYSRVGTVMGIELVEVPLLEDFSYDVAALLRAARNAGLVFLTSPHNPVGMEIDISDVERIARACPGLVALDEAYFEFSGRTGIPLLEKLENLVILRTFSKAWCSAGMRLGYLLGKPDLVAGLRRARLPFSVGMLQQTAGKILMENRADMQTVVNTVIQERERLWAILEARSEIRVYLSRANFLLFECLNQLADKIAARLARDGVAVRRFDDPRLRKAIRVTVGTQEENQGFLSALDVALGEGGT